MNDRAPMNIPVITPKKFCASPTHEYENPFVNDVIFFDPAGTPPGGQAVTEPSNTSPILLILKILLTAITSVVEL
jgi:hypothetical protein